MGILLNVYYIKLEGMELMNKILEVHDLKKHFKTPNGNLHAVDGVTFSVETGETLGIVGESGCGKSTLGRTILGLLDATSGKIIFKNNDITKTKGKERFILRKDMQIIFQDPFSSLNPRMCVSEIIAEPLHIYKIYKSKQELQKRVTELMNTVGLAERLSLSYPHELDGGRRQRIGIARALALNPSFIVCDEPVSALDVSIQAQILNLMQDIQDEYGLTYIFITHDLSVVKHVSNDILVMYLGCMVEICNSEELFEQQFHPYTKGLLSAIPIPKLRQRKERKILQGEISSPINPHPSCRFVTRCDYARDKCFNTEPKQQEITPNHFVSCHYAFEINKIK